MSEDMFQFLNARRIKARLLAEETAWLLGFPPENISILVKAGFLKPLGGSPPPQQAVKYFAAVEIEKLAKDTAFLHRATKFIYAYWKTQNSARRIGRSAAKDHEQLAA